MPGLRQDRQGGLPEERADACRLGGARRPHLSWQGSIPSIIREKEP